MNYKKINEMNTYIYRLKHFIDNGLTKQQLSAIYDICIDLSAKNDDYSCIIIPNAIETVQTLSNDFKTINKEAIKIDKLVGDTLNNYFSSWTAKEKKAGKKEYVMKHFDKGKKVTIKYIEPFVDENEERLNEFLAVAEEIKKHLSAIVENDTEYETIISSLCSIHDYLTNYNEKKLTKKAVNDFFAVAKKVLFIIEENIPYDKDALLTYFELYYEVLEEDDEDEYDDDEEEEDWYEDDED